MAHEVEHNLETVIESIRTVLTFTRLSEGRNDSPEGRDGRGTIR